MRRFNLLLVASVLQLCGARQHSFSVYDDLLAHPQFEVVFSDAYIHESEALALLESSTKDPSSTYAADFSSQTDLAGNVRESAAVDAGAASRSSYDGDNGAEIDDNSHQVSETFEIINTPPTRYLCSVPVIAPPPALNQTANELAKAEEARELSRAYTKGWELLRGLEGECLYFVFGWWSYTFCYGKSIVQFHALPSGIKGTPPVRDPTSEEYVLGTALAPPQTTTKSTNSRPNSSQDQKQAGADAANSIAPPNTELQVKGDQRYLVQRLEGGSICDLTGRPRTIEVQYHCHPGALFDRIGWIKEVTTCTYLMLVQTPRLCEDVAFLPPKETRAHPISCRPIVNSEEEAALYSGRQATIEAMESKAAAAAVGTQQAKSKDANPTNPFTGMTIGGVVVGGRAVLGSGEDDKPVAKIQPPRQLAQTKKAVSFVPLVDTFLGELNKEIKKKGGPLTQEDIDGMEVDPETLEELRKELERIAKDMNWDLDASEVSGRQVLEFFAVETEEGDEEAEGGGKGKVVKAQKAKSDGDAKGKGGKDGQDKQVEGEDEQQGSEEVFFKEEL
ncbi:glucosidase II beta subunit-like protein-domain-containing protein [Bombardia bombarda]|uniref:Endoplasmic reticulum lectin n=1 Tax=Bombardia bombarda TaxID=252184 RepID=A0AA39XJI0_9PEZI|nr:glucosidase II beta subunit-like protein-domain-containing protein [Bombardia bombarda]